MTCDHGRYGPSRCRKRARFMIAYREPFGRRIGPMGDSQLYRVALAIRCGDHDTVAEEMERVTAEEYARRKEAIVAD